MVPAISGTLDAPKGVPILTISGAITNINAGEAAVFDRGMLEALGFESISTKTPWFDGVARFDGVRMDKLMEVVGARGKSVTAVALNDYVTTIPIDDFARFGVILALMRDGEYMSVRNKGPLFIVYPYDSDTELQSQIYFGRSAWQVAKLTVQ
ncbi:molybdopterin-dependent oxidoreductase [Tianweitania sediminis]|uniref:Oxidoreductase n=1 Tax=Tianweitania sediminis TaxID=1502156 RepID=A0A8J7RH10_9HYPH|nr:molybdopterin-dependent oxidoreductase [Tianweitania sediminis]MBP0438296.1 oxidoreductase [Tianweitania sediminis]